MKENIGTAIKRCVSKFKEQHGLTPVIGCELEFYVDNKKFLNTIKLHPVKLESEEGENQFELQFLPSDDVMSALKLIDTTRRKLQIAAKKFGTNIHFAAKPYENKPGSGLHVHLNFLDKNGRNVFEKTSAEESSYLLHSVGGLLATMAESLKFFAPSEASYKRYSDRSMTSPSTISWGVNNRTAALRITPPEKGCRRVEHRVAGADADVFDVVLRYWMERILESARR